MWVGSLMRAKSGISDSEKNNPLKSVFLVVSWVSADLDLELWHDNLSLTDVEGSKEEELECIFDNW